MVFSSEFFLYGFMPIFFSLYYLCGDRRKNPTLLAASLIFYLIGAGSTVLLLLLSIVFNQFLAGHIARAKTGRRQALLWIGVIANVATLGYYKYGTFIWQLASNAADFLELENFPAAPFIPLPIGISFFTFQAVSYLIDVYRREVPPARSMPSLLPIIRCFRSSSPARSSVTARSCRKCTSGDWIGRL